MASQTRTQVPERKLQEALQGAFEETMQQVMAAVNAAPDGQVIAGSEQEVKRLMDEFRRRAFETATQLRTDSAESAFSPSGGSADG